MEEEKDRFYTLRAKSFDELVLYLNDIEEDDFVLHIAVDKQYRYNDKPTVVAIIERGKVQVSAQFERVVGVTNSA